MRVDKRWARGLTLIEVLIVVAIMTVLAGTLYVLMGGVREKTRQTVCISNLRQIGQAVAMYRADYEGRSAAGAHAMNPLVSMGVPPRGSILFQAGYLKDSQMMVAKCPDDPLAARPGSRVFSYDWCAMMPATFPAELATRIRERLSREGDKIPVATDLHHWEQYYDRSNLPYGQRSRDMFWLVLRLDGSVNRMTTKMPTEGGCSL